MVLRDEGKGREGIGGFFRGWVPTVLRESLGESRREEERTGQERTGDERRVEEKKKRREERAEQKRGERRMEDRRGSERNLERHNISRNGALEEEREREIEKVGGRQSGRDGEGDNYEERERKIKKE
jgi:hypothetical protein